MAMKIFFLGIIFLLFSPRNAHAYFDPGTGSMLLQSLAAGVIAIAIFWGKIKNAIRKVFTKNDVDSEMRDKGA